MRTGPGNTAIDWKCSEQRHQDKDHGRNWCERAGGNDRYPWLIPKCREIVDPGEAHDLPPGMLMPLFHALIRTFWLMGITPHQP
jgi:hypothetical protein